VRNIQRPAANAAEFNAGTEASFRRRPDEGPRAPVQLVPARAPVPTPAPPPAQPAMVPATSVNMDGAQPAPASSPAAAPSTPSTPAVQAVPLPRPDVTPIPAQR
jgi:general secretion pathway protein D